METQKQYSGPKNNTARTRRKLLDAVGEIIKTDGHHALNVKNVTEKSGVSRGHLYYHFNEVGNLIEEYIRDKDYWVGFTKKVTELIKQHKGNFGRELAESILVNQLDYFFHNREMQQVILWQLSEKNPILYRIGEEREQLGERLFQMTDPYFHSTDIDIRAVTALLVAGIYHLVLHSQSNESLFCGIDIRTYKGMTRIKKAIKQIMANTYGAAKTEKENRIPASLRSLRHRALHRSFPPASPRRIRYSSIPTI